ncbi:MAG: caspase family protein [Lentilitoribacter sp.]
MAEKYALLIGVGEYENDSIPDLEAPKNDVSLMYKLMSDLNVPEDNITVLATGKNSLISEFEIDGQPTRSAILQSLQSLRENLTEGDHVAIYISSHGTSQPDQAVGSVGHDEVDGYDEVIMPSDAGNWDRRKGTVENGILDDEIGHLIENIRQRGASVWLVVDACHSGTALRSHPDRPLLAAGDIEKKYVNPDKLGLPKEFLPPAPKGTKPNYFKSDRTSQLVSGSLTAFYAVRPHELALAARWLNSEGEYLPYSLSLLTHALYTSLNSEGLISYQEMAHSLRGTYAYVNATILPQFDGEFNRSILSDAWLPQKRFEVSYTKQVLLLRAGLLDQLNLGTVLRVKNSRYPDESALYEIDYITTVFASLVPVEKTDSPAFKDPYGGYIAELVRLGEEAPTKVALKADNADNFALKAIEELIKKQTTKSIEFVGQDTSSADVTIIDKEDGLDFVSKTKSEQKDSSQGNEPVFVSCDDIVVCSEMLQHELINYAKRTQLEDILVDKSYAENSPKFKFALSSKIISSEKGRDRCFEYNPILEFTDIDLRSHLKHGLMIDECETLMLGVHYFGDKALDLTVLYRHQDGTLIPIGCDGFVDDAKLRLLSHDAQWNCLPGKFVADHAEISGRFQSGLVIVAVEQPPSLPVRTYRFLEETVASNTPTIEVNADFEQYDLLMQNGSEMTAQEFDWPALIFLPIELRPGE